MADMENVEEVVGTREAVAVATESGGTSTRRRRRLVMNETAATGGVMFTDE